jgi:hypothetical protein
MGASTFFFGAILFSCGDETRIFFHNFVFLFFAGIGHDFSARRYVRRRKGRAISAILSPALYLF